MRRIIALGDSTLQFNDITKYPQTGWPQALPLVLRENVEVINFAKNGRSTKSFIAEGRFSEASKVIGKGDLVLIEFGHNDYKDDPLRYSTKEEYKANLAYMAKEVLAKGANPILLTSISERVFKDGIVIDTHHGYPLEMKKLAKELNIPCIDLQSLTKDVLEKTGVEGSKRYFMYYGPDEYLGIPGKEDNTHLRYDGAVMVAKCFAGEMRKQNLYAEWFREC